MFTADDARRAGQDDLDRRIRAAVHENDGGNNAAYLRVYCDDPWVNEIEYELERRGFINIQVPDIVIKGDVYFEWDKSE